MSGMKGIVEIDTGQDRKHVSLQKRDQQFECGQRDGHCQRHHAGDPADRTERGTEQDDEAGEHLQRDMAGQHVGEQTDAVRERSRQERHDLNRDNQGQDVDRDARWHEDPEEPQAIFVEAVDQYREEDEQCKCGSDNDVAL